MNNQGKVIAVGDKDISVSVGDKVIYDFMGADEVTVGDKKLLLIKMENILAKVD